MLRKLRERSQSESGFTLVELLVVILIIGILAAIAVPTFLSQRTKAQDADTKSGVRNAQTALEAYTTDSATSNYVGATPAALKAIEPTLNNLGVTFAVNVTDGDTAYVEAKSAETNNVFRLTVNAGITSRQCGLNAFDGAAGTGGCPSNGQW